MIKDKEKLNKILWILIFIIIPLYLIFNFPIFNLATYTKNIIGIAFTIIVSIVILKKEVDNNKAISMILAIIMFTLNMKLYGIVLIASIFSLITNKNYLFIYFVILILTFLGIFLGYILEYGEVSNTINFTIKNILLTLIFMPILVIIITLLIEKIIKSKKNQKI